MSRPKKKLSCAFPNYEDISNWNVHRLLQWLRQNGLHSSIDTFAEERIDGRTLLFMTDTELNSKRRINEKDKKKLVKALAILPNSQISRQPGIMTRLRGQLKKKIGRDDLGAPPPVPQADYYTAMDDVVGGGGGGGGWGSDEFESSDDSEYEEPPEDCSVPEGIADRAKKFQSIQQKFQAAGFTLPAQQQGVYEVDDEEIYDAPEPDDIDSHREYLADESLYVPPQGTDELETYEVPEIEANPAPGKRLPRRIPPPIRTQQEGYFSNQPMSPTEPPPPVDYFGYGGPEGVYDLPPDADDDVEVQPPLPPVISKPSLPARFGDPAFSDPQKPSGNVAQKMNLFTCGGPKSLLPRPGEDSKDKLQSGLPKEPSLPDRSTKPNLGGHGGRLSPARSKPPRLPSKDDSVDDVRDMALPPRPSLPAPGLRPTFDHLKETQFHEGREFHPPAPGRNCKPTMPSRDTKPAMPFRGSKPALPFMDAKPPLPATDTKPPLPATDTKPPLPATDTKPPLPATDNRPPLPATDNRPPLPATDNRPPLPGMDAMSSQPGMEVVPGRHPKPFLPGRDTKPVLPGRDSKPVLPDGDSRFMLPGRDSKPTVPDGRSNSIFSGRDMKPVVPSADLKPTLPVRDSKPVLPVEDSRPACPPPAPGQDSRPAFSPPLPGQDSRPAFPPPVPGQDSRPAISPLLPGQDSRPAFPPPVPGGKSRPACLPPVPGGNSRPACLPSVPGGNSRPALPGRDTKPVIPGGNSRPALPGRDTKPVIAGADFNPAISERRGSEDNRFTEQPSNMQENGVFGRGTANALSDEKPRRPVSPKPMKRNSSPTERQPPLPISAKPSIFPPSVRHNSSSTERQPPLPVSSKPNVRMNQNISPVEQPPLPVSPKPNVRSIGTNRSTSPVENQPPLPVSAKPNSLMPSANYPSSFKPPPMKPFSSAKEKKLEDYDWFQGDIDRKACEAALKRSSQDGLFMVRNSKNYPGEFSISFFYKGEIKHLRIRKRPDNMFSVGAEKANEKAFRNVVELVDFHQSEPLSLKTGGLMKLKHGCPL
ncbi:basic proline-rich protein-like isoform X2 [Corticium candelabrum]|uniref:basic proline-rich protein-like isoform X2 n=1 Tax=Corticium candelabrum TaxID=121492 RepID=UPI002E272036|nr:basic proline-rich protein-like isoform X2 [Corticium candelabrum]